jgi:hypothetical protein
VLISPMMTKKFRKLKVLNLHPLKSLNNIIINI